MTPLHRFMAARGHKPPGPAKTTRVFKLGERGAPVVEAGPPVGSRISDVDHDMNTGRAITPARRS